MKFLDVKIDSCSENIILSPFGPSDSVTISF